MVSVFICANLLYIFLWWDICSNFSLFFSKLLDCLSFVYVWIQVFIRNTFWEYFLPVQSLSFYFEFLLCSVQFSSVQSINCVLLLVTPWTATSQASLSITNSCTQTHVHWVGDAIQPFHPLSSSSPPSFDLSQHQGLFKWVSSLHQVA